MLALIHVWDLSVRGKFFECKQMIDSLRSKLPSDYPSHLVALEAYNCSFIGWRKSAQDTLSRAKEDARNDALAWYMISRAHAFQAEWKESVEAGFKALELCPVWTRVRCSLNDSLLATGDVVGSRKLLAAAPNYPNIAFDFGQAICALRKSCIKFL